MTLNFTCCLIARFFNAVSTFSIIKFLLDLSIIKKINGVGFYSSDKELQMQSYKIIKSILKGLYAVFTLFTDLFWYSLLNSCFVCK